VSDALTEDIFGSTTDEEVITDVFDSGEASPESPYKEDSKPPPDRKAGPRASGADYIGAAVAIAGTVLVSKQIDVPVGRVIQFQSPVSGKILDKFIANTWIDKLLQPLFKKGGDLEELGAVVGLPILIGICERKPEMAPILMGPMEEFIMQTFSEMATMRRAEKSKIRRTVKSADLRDMLDIPEDVKDEQIPMFVVHSFFAPMTGGEEQNNGN
jgi:hypothetical protein